MPFNLLLLPLPGGYLFITRFYGTAYKCSGYSGYRLILSASVVGLYRDSTDKTLVITTLYADAFEAAIEKGAHLSAEELAKVPPIEQIRSAGIFDPDFYEAFVSETRHAHAAPAFQLPTAESRSRRRDSLEVRRDKPGNLLFRLFWGIQ